ACFILSVDDTMDSILNWYREEGLIFKGGSGAGLNLSRIRSSKELLSSGGTASGPVSFMRGADASAGTIKSGGATRRAAKMVVLDVDHPDIEEFVATKAKEEAKIRVLPGVGAHLGVQPLFGVHAPGQLQLQPRLAEPAEVPRRRRAVRRRALPEGRRADHHGDGHLDLLRRLPHRADRRHHPQVPSAGHRLRQPRCAV